MAEQVETSEARQGVKLQKKWQREIQAALKRCEKFYEQGVKTNKRYRDESTEGLHVEKYRLNLFNNHITTLESMLYGNTPKVTVKRKHDDHQDDQARVAGLILKRHLDQDIRQGGEDMASVIRAALGDRLRPGLGQARVRYDVETEETEDENGVKSEELIEEECHIEYVHWKDFLWGYGRIWADVPWVAYRSYMRRSEAKKRFGEEVYKTLEYVKRDPYGSDAKKTISESNMQSTWQTAEVWEIWDKESYNVYWYSPGAPKILDEQEDPYELSTFFPSPPPMAANCTTDLFMPKSDFAIAQDLYNEIDILQTRIHLITRALRLVGVYDKNQEEIGRMLKEGTDNDLIPVEKWAVLSEKGGLENVIEWFPLDQVAEALVKLREMRDEAIQLLYQVTGMSDILRGGSTHPREAKGTQELKAKFASVRVQKLQDEFARFASDLMTIKAEIISRHFDPETILEKSNIQRTPDAESASEALQLVKSPEEVPWRIEIKPESIAMVDYAQLQNERTQYITALSTYLQSAQAVLKQVPAATPFLLELMKWGLAGFKGSEEIEGAVDRAIDAAMEASQKPQGNEPNPEEEKRKTIQLKDRLDAQKDMRKHEMDREKTIRDFELAMMEMAAEGEIDISKEEAQMIFNMAEEKYKSGLDQGRRAAANE